MRARKGKIVKRIELEYKNLRCADGDVNAESRNPGLTVSWLRVLGVSCIIPLLIRLREEIFIMRI